MPYTISQMAELFHVKPHTLRFYEKEGIIQPDRTDSGIRVYSEAAKAQMEMAMCLKSTGMSLKDIRRYFDLVQEGDSTLGQRLDIFTQHRSRVLEEIDELQKHLAKIEHKIEWCRSTLEKQQGKS